MTSEERRAARRKRREAERQAKREAAIAMYDDYEKVISANALIHAAKQSRRGVRWKASVQRYFINLLRNTWDLRRKLKKGISPVMGFICFTINERGKTRHIRSVHFKERVVQRSVCDNALVPVLSRSLVYDNGASLKGKGIHFALYRCRHHLREYYRRHGTNKGWVLLVDFSGYFDNILHGPVKQMIVDHFNDRRLRWLIWQFVKSFGEKSLGIGSQVSQILAVAYCNRIDHYAREVLGLNLSARYNDDSYFFHESKEYLEHCLELLIAKYAEYGIKVNPKKTQIIPLRRFTFLKVRFNLLDTGKVIMKPCQKSITRERNKLKAFRKKLDNGEMKLDEIRCNYESWRGYHSKIQGRAMIQNMDKLYYELFGLRPSAYSKKKCKKKGEKKL